MDEYITIRKEIHDVQTGEVTETSVILRLVFTDKPEEREGYTIEEYWEETEDEYIQNWDYQPIEEG